MFRKWSQTEGGTSLTIIDSRLAAAYMHRHPLAMQMQLAHKPTSKVSKTTGERDLLPKTIKQKG
jgi:hypothetical protein